MQVHEAFPWAEAEIEQLFVGRSRELDVLQRTLVADSQRVAVIEGIRGSGKTALLMMFGRDARELFPGGYAFTRGSHWDSPVQFAMHNLRLPLIDRALFVVDDAQIVSQTQLAELEQFVLVHPRLNLLLATSQPVHLPILRSERLTLDGLSEAEYYALLSRRLTNVDPDILQKLWALTAGNALVGDLANRTIRDNILSWNQLIASLQDFQHTGVVGPDGQPIEPSTQVAPRVVIDVSNVNAEMVEMLRRDPSKFRSLSPRKFEEIIAELLSRMGYEIELTPFSGDGGFDMYAAKTESLGRFLYLVECKRYVPPDKVGVHVVRSLYGTVQQKQANAGVVVTTSFFTKGAKELQEELVHQIHLRDYIELQRWLKII